MLFDIFVTKKSRLPFIKPKSVIRRLNWVKA